MIKRVEETVPRWVCKSSHRHTSLYSAKECEARTKIQRLDRGWLEQRNKAIVALYAAQHSQAAIARALGLAKPTIRTVLRKAGVLV